MSFSFDEDDIITLEPPPPGTVRHDDGSTTEPVPPYSLEDTQPFQARIDKLNSLGYDDLLVLPITTYPRGNYSIASSYPAPPALGGRRASISSAETAAAAAAAAIAIATAKIDADIEARELSRDVIAQFFSNIESKRDDAVETLISQGLIGPMTPNRVGETPLMAAVRVGNVHMVRRLAQLGAPVNEMGHLPLPDGERRHSGMTVVRGNLMQPAPLGTERTPLMVAAEGGNMVVAKVLMEEFEADDGIMAPDGQLALRLAAKNGHRELVEYLPMRRGGAWTRWKVANAKYMKLIKIAAGGIVGAVLLVVWWIPKAVLWDAPKSVATFGWKRRKRVGKWCKRQATEFPARAMRVGKAIGRGLAKIPHAGKVVGKGLLKGVKKIPDLVKSLVRLVWKVIKLVCKIIKWFVKKTWKAIKAIPDALKVIFTWIWEGIKKVSGAMGQVALSTASLIHTAIVAVIGFSQRVTLNDVWNGFRNLVNVIFVTVPKAFWSFLKKSGKISLQVMTTLFGCFGTIIWSIGYGIIWLLKYIPERIGKIVVYIARSLGKGFEEVLVCFNPKRVSTSHT